MDKWNGKMNIVERILQSGEEHKIKNLIRVLELFNLRIKDYVT